MMAEMKAAPAAAKALSPILSSASERVIMLLLLLLLLLLWLVVEGAVGCEGDIGEALPSKSTWELEAAAAAAILEVEGKLPLEPTIPYLLGIRV